RRNTCGSGDCISDVCSYNLIQNVDQPDEMNAVLVEAKGSGWYSFNKNGVHFIGLVNVLNLQAGGLGQLGDEQLEWLENDLKGLGIGRASCRDGVEIGETDEG